ncbi:4-diphosphocytidyl-2C-methyl-D-erythritol kinase [Fulvimarina endophytica]|uniref:4-diphosphocytidyl-2C-methyl-D-erythritol kinase n=1 Tax=Fulvimarina endophytica TaxID=2293836 RepID=A0A371XAK5_9HYPH|nr:molybdopterin-binding/glycosyltransferase family 2 protein [Fulvimarina endophytica]RFC66256.1 4-diphosphocytidyl-2C-methyl-D-erythritol kinase [Fulvimarina endophytica]
MRFGEVAIEDAENAVLAHATRIGDVDLAKGTRLSRIDVETLRDAGIHAVVAARLDAGDIGEDEAAARIGAALGCEHLEVGEATTGRVNLHARRAGLVTIDRASVDALNAVDPAITLATLASFSPVREGQMVATIKIIPLAVPGTSVERALDVIADRETIRLSPFRARSVSLIQTILPNTKAKMLDKTRRVTAERLAVSGSWIESEARVAHRSEDLAKAINDASSADLIIVFGASAVIDRRDVIPDAIERAGGAISYFGMPVDPGNLLLMGRLGDGVVIGAPGCARSPKENGFDWVLDRMLADLEFGPEVLQRFGVGGLLAEIETRPRPRQIRGKPSRSAVDILVLAAGRSTRMGENHKLLMEISPGLPLVRHAVDIAMGADKAHEVRVVVGHREEEVRAALEGRDLTIVSNRDFASGLSTSLRRGFEEAGDIDGILVLLADQPFLTSQDIDRMIDVFRESEGRAVVAASDGHKRRNPVILPMGLKGAVAALTGDLGAASILDGSRYPIKLVDIGDRASFDVDTPERFEEARHRFDKERGRISDPPQG